MPPGQGSGVAGFACMLALGAALLVASACHGALEPLADDPGAPDAAPAGTISFRPNVQTDLETSGCTGVADCHGMDAVPMVVHAGPVADAEWLANYEEVRSRAGTVASSLLLTKPVGIGGHPRVLAAGSPLLARWRLWIDDGAPFTAP